MTGQSHSVPSNRIQSKPNSIYYKPIAFSSMYQHITSIQSNCIQYSYPTLVYALHINLLNFKFPTTRQAYQIHIRYSKSWSYSSELSTGRMDPRVGSGHDFAEFWQVWSGQHFGFLSVLLIILWYLNRCESSNMNLRILHSDWLIFYDI